MESLTQILLWGEKWMGSKSKTNTYKILHIITLKPLRNAATKNKQTNKQPGYPYIIHHTLNLFNHRILFLILLSIPTRIYILNFEKC